MSKINQGVFGVAESSSANCVWPANWGTNTAVITVDLGKDFMVDGADASAYYEGSNQTFSKIKVEVSTDGASYNTVVPETTLVEGENATVISEHKVEIAGITLINQKELLSVNNFKPTKARYVRVTLTGGQYQIVPNEVVVFGK